MAYILIRKWKCGLVDQPIEPRVPIKSIQKAYMGLISLKFNKARFLQLISRQSRASLDAYSSWNLALKTGIKAWLVVLLHALRTLFQRVLAYSSAHHCSLSNFYSNCIYAKDTGSRIHQIIMEISPAMSSNCIEQWLFRLKVVHLVGCSTLTRIQPLFCSMSRQAVGRIAEGINNRRIIWN